MPFNFALTFSQVSFTSWFYLKFHMYVRTSVKFKKLLAVRTKKLYLECLNIIFSVWNLMLNK